MPKLQAPAHGVTVRMYRQGHGDCFLLAFPRDGGGDPVYMLIDCGYKPGSQAFLHGQPIGNIVDHIGESTGRRLDLAVITHEHQDHVNGFWKEIDPYFGDFHIDAAWLAWTEDPNDDLANQLREDHQDQLLNLVAARQKLALAVGEDDAAVRRVDSLLRLEFGGERERFSAAEMTLAVDDPSKSQNKQAMKLIKDKARENGGVRYLMPGEAPLEIAGAQGVRVFVLGPPRSETLLTDEDPRGPEGFPDENALGLSFGAAATAETGADLRIPFSQRFAVPFEAAVGGDIPFFSAHYGANEEGANDRDGIEATDNAPWRRIDADWLYSAEDLALKLNTGINNTSLVLAIELPVSKKVLFFAADAQRGNWISWTNHGWLENGVAITVRELLARTVLYKVGHHGSHNATLNGTVDADYANLSWMGTGTAAAEFTAMITAVNEWALTKNSPPWRHPLPSIKSALAEKARGRVFQSDVDLPAKPETASDADWNTFTSRSVFDELFFDYQVLDE